MKFYQTKKFQKLNRVWRSELARSGFEDIEDKRGLLKHPDSRTIAFPNREVISNFFSELGFFLGNTPDLPARDRKILELYAEGIWIQDICKRTKASDSTVRNTIKRYKKRLLGQGE